MPQRIILALALIAGGYFLAATVPAEAGPPGYHGCTPEDAWMYWYATHSPWHAPYYHTAFGKPVSLVVPPIANLQTHYNWGVSGTTMTPIYHQYARPYPAGFGAPEGAFRPTPFWPSSTDQFGVYYIRAPW